MPASRLEVRKSFHRSVDIFGFAHLIIVKMSEKTRLKCTVYVGGLDQAVSVQTLAEAFVPFGEVVDITLPKPDLPNSNDNHRGFGYVEFDLPEDAKEAIDNMDGSELYGRTIKVAPAKPQKDANEGLGSKTAIWEQVCLRARTNSAYIDC